MPLASRTAVAAILAVPLVWFLHPGPQAHPKPGDRPAADSLPGARANDNRRPAGTLKHGVLTVHLVVTRARWHPERDDGPFADVETFAEEGQASSIPGPLIRVPVGTLVEATVRNALRDSSIFVSGLQSHPAKDDSVRVGAGESHAFHFVAGAAGTYLYRATIARITAPKGEREQLAGALVVDAVGARTDDRVFVINIWGDPIDTTGYRNALAINGRSWPFTERVTAALGDSLRWRIVNASGRSHPMHLHGFYFRVDAAGDGRRDSSYARDDAPLVVTQNLDPGETVFMSWQATRAGNWLYHCHLGFHVFPNAARLTPPALHHAADMAHDPADHMAGLVLGIIVKPDAGVMQAARVRPRQLRLFVDEGRRRSRATRAMGFVLQRGALTPAVDSLEVASPPLILTRGEPTDVVVVNRLAEPTGVHWHGIELESFSDGVPGWSGSGYRVAPLIAPGDSFVAHLTLPRAGTFIYHTHLNDFEQLTSGLYGGIIVLEPGARFDPSRDHLFVAGWDGPEDPPHVFVNGDSISAPLLLARGVTHRLRFVNVGVAVSTWFTVRRDSSLAAWRALAKDGADLPPRSMRVGPARQRVAVGETFDFEVGPWDAGTYRLAVEHGDGTVVWSQQLVVR
jgi:FtsP/CotA-like multicopper oxidase with cupredoxin domain